jgi:hypothetical protein
VLEVKYRRAKVEYFQMKMSSADAQSLLEALQIAWDKGYHTTFILETLRDLKATSRYSK